MIKVKADDSTQKFEVGSTYRVNDTNRSTVKVVKRTRCYITLEGSYVGRFRIYDANLFGLGENIWIPAHIAGFKHNYICSAAHAVEGR